MRLAPGRGERLQAGAGLRRLLTGQVYVAATPHQRKLQQDDLGGFPCICTAIYQSVQITVDLHAQGLLMMWM